MTTPRLVSLSDEQMAHVYQAAGALDQRARGPFLQELATLLRTQAEIGDGAVHRAIRDAQRKFVSNVRKHANWHQ